MPYGIMVMGPESSGTRFLTRCFIKAGCAGQYTHEQAFDKELPLPEHPIVWRRSVPYWGEWPDIAHCLFRLTRIGYIPHAVVITRDWYATACSQVANKHALDVELAERQMQRAMRYIYSNLMEAGVDFTWVTYEGLVQRPKATLEWLMERFGLPVPDIEVHDGNAKYYALIKANG